MFFLDIVFVVVCILFLQIQHVIAQAGAEEPPDPGQAPGYPEQKDPEKDGAEFDEDRLAHIDSYTFVVLIDIVFTDGSKKTCTGTIIDDNAVITAAHCFITSNEEIQPELTMSFVILGTKKMFDSGYESYLPIERIETHPNFKGWTADLAIVFTFAGMVTENHGTIVPLAVERSSTPVDSNVTVFSWGHCNERTSKTGPAYQGEQTAYPPTGDNEESTQIRANRKSKLSPYNKYPEKNQLRSRSVDNSNDQQRVHDRKVEPYKVVRAQKKRHLQSDGSIKSSGSRYLSDVDYSDDINYRRNRRFETRSKKIDENSPNNQNRPRPSEPQEIDENSTNRNRRRLSEPQPNNFTIEVFGFVNAQTCKKLVDQCVPPLYSIQNNNEVLCYESDMHYITVEDSGAPAIQHGKLVAVTVGGVESNGEHVAVGMKMSCFCSWIVETLPMYEEVIKIKCCKNCCDVKQVQAQETNNNQEETDQLPYKPGGRGKSNQRYRVAEIDDIDENQYEDQSRKKRYKQ